MSASAGDWVPVADVREFLDEHHYLGAARRGFAWRDQHGVIVLSPPTSRRLPANWLDLTRWCLVDGKGSVQWATVRRALLDRCPNITTVVSYSDPAQGHSGALYRACGWVWAPTWHRLRPPPTGNGRWSSSKTENVKDRWVDCLRVDPKREEILVAKDTSILRAMPFARYVDPPTKKGRPVRGAGGADFKMFRDYSELLS